MVWALSAIIGARSAYQPALFHTGPSRLVRLMNTSMSAERPCMSVVRRARNCSSLKISIRVLIPVLAVNSATMSRIACDQGWLLNIKLMVWPSCACQLNSCAGAGPTASAVAISAAATRLLCNMVLSSLRSYGRVLCSGRDVAAINRDGHPVDEAGGGRGEEDGRAGKLFRLRPSVRRQPRHYLGVKRLLLAPAAADLGVDPARRDGVHADAILRIGEGERFREPHDASFRRGVAGDHRGAEIGIHRPDVDKAAPRPREMGPEGGCEPEVADEMDGHDVPKHLRLVLLVTNEPSRAVDEYVQGVDLGSERVDGRIVAHVERLEAKALVLRGRLDVGNRNAGAAAAEGAGKGGPNASGAA